MTPEIALAIRNHLSSGIGVEDVRVMMKVSYRTISAALINHPKLAGHRKIADRYAGATVPRDLTDAQRIACHLTAKRRQVLSSLRSGPLNAWRLHATGASCGVARVMTKPNLGLVQLIGDQWALTPLGVEVANLPHPWGVA